MFHVNRSENVTALCLVFGLVFLLSGCDKIKLPAPTPEPEPEVVKSIVPDADTGTIKPVPPIDPNTDLYGALLATPTHLRSDGQLTMLASNPETQQKLVELDLTNSPVTDAGLQHLVVFKNLKALNLSKTRITNVGLEALPNVTGLEVLILEEALSVSDAGMAALAKSQHLQKLVLIGTPVTDVAFKDLAEIPELKSLNVDNNPNLLGRQFSEAVRDGKFKRLEELSVRGTQFGFYGLLQIGNLKNLRVLRAGDSNVTDAALDTIQGCTALVMLDLSKSALTPVVIKKIIKLQKLEHLNFSGSSSINDDVFNILKSMKQLKVLDVNDTSVTEDAVKLLKEKFLKETVILFNGMEY